MFSAWKYVFAKNRVIMGLEQRHQISTSQADQMKAVSGSPMNRLYGVGIIKQGLAKDKYAAVAAVFSRIAFHYESEIDDSLNRADWIAAAIHAMTLSGADIYKAEEIVDGLVKMHRSIE